MSGQSIGTVIGGIIGVILAPYTGGMSITMGMALGGAIGGALDPPEGTHTEGARLSDLSQQTATYGATIPRVFGKSVVVGNVFWLEGNKIKEVATTQTYGGKGMGGQPEQSSTTYSYYATFAIGVHDGEITAVNKIWLSGKLWYHRDSDNVDALLASDDKESKFRIYYGTDTQLPEPRMQADVGAANCPAYRGLAYIVFYDLPLEPFGNSLSACQVKVELATSAVTKTLIVSPELYYPDTNASYQSPPIFYNGRIYLTYSGLSGLRYEMHVFDENLNLLAKNSIPQNNVSSWSHFYENSVYTMDHVSAQRIRRYTIDYISNSLATVPLDPFVLETPNPVQILCGAERFVYVSSSSYYGIIDLDNRVNYDMSSLGLGSATFAQLAHTPGSDRVYLMVGVGTDTKLAIFSYVSDVLTHLATHNNAAYPSWPQGVTSNKQGLLISGNVLYTKGATLGRWDVSNPASISLINQTANITQSSDSIMLFNNHVIRVSASQLTAYDMITLATTNTITRTSIGSHTVAVIHDGEVYSADRSRGFSRFKVGVNGVAAPVTLASIVDELSDSLIDTSALTATLAGFREPSSSTPRALIEQLQGAFPFDVIQNGYTLKAIPRGTGSVLTVPADDIDGLMIDREIDNALISEVQINYLDSGRDYDTNSQVYSRYGFKNARTMDMPLTLTAGQAAKIAQQLVYIYWLERYTLRFKLPIKYNALQPTDVITITAQDGKQHVVRLRNVSYGETIDCVAKLASQTVYTPSGDGEEGQRTTRVLTRAKHMYAIPLDIPLLDDGLDGLIEPVAMYGAGDGGNLFISKDGNQYTFAATRKGSDAVGNATNALTAWTQPIWDKTQTLTVALPYGSLASVSELEVLNGANHFAYGAHGRWEIIAAKNCVQIDAVTWQLSDFLRGRLGTEQYTGTHGQTDTVVALTRGLQQIKWSNFGISQYFKSVGFGKTLADVSPVTHDYNAVAAKPLSPVYAKAVRLNAQWDTRISWIRRTRFDTGLPNGADVPVFEAAESYVIEVWNSSFATLLNTYTASSQQFTYSGAAQVTDYGGNVNVFYLKIYQVSALVGRGYPLQVSLISS